MDIRTELQQLKDVDELLNKTIKDLTAISKKQPDTVVEVIDPRNIKLKCKKVYGKCCYELSGETSNESYDLLEFIMNILFGDEIDIYKDCFTDKELKDMYEEDDESEDYKSILIENKAYGKLSEYMVNIFAHEIIDGDVGHSYGEHYEDIKLNKVLTLQDLKRSIRAINIDLDLAEGKLNLDKESFNNLWFF